MCSAEATCVSLCNPGCAGSEICTAAGECVAKTKSSPDASSTDGQSGGSAPRAPLPERHFELGLGLGYQRVASFNYFTPALAFRYVLALGLEPHLLFGVRGGPGIGPSTFGEVGLDLGYRHRFGDADSTMRGGFFVTMRPELWPGASGSATTGRTAFVAGGSIGGFIEWDRVILSFPIAGGGGKVLAHSGGFGYFSACAEAAVRF